MIGKNFVKFISKQLSGRSSSLSKSAAAGLMAIFAVAGNGMAASTSVSDHIPTLTVSEPTTLLLVGVGFLILAGIGNKKFKK